MSDFMDFAVDGMPGTFSVPARTKNKGHHPHMVRNVGTIWMYCNCQAAEFGRECWAVKVLREEFGDNDPFGLQKKQEIGEQDNG